MIAFLLPQMACSQAISWKKLDSANLNLADAKTLKSRKLTKISFIFVISIACGNKIFKIKDNTIHINSQNSYFTN